MTAIITTAERYRRHQNDLRAFRQRHLYRRSHQRFRRDLAVIPRLFLDPGKIRIARLQQEPEQVIANLRGRVVWTLDTASRLVCGIGLLSARDLTGYFEKEILETAAEEQWIEPVQSRSIELAPLFERPPCLVAHLDGNPKAWDLPSGDRVVAWDDLIRDLKGTLGWRPDLLTRVEDAYRRVEQGSAVETVR